MGQDKALLSFGNHTLIEFLFEKYKALFQNVYLSAKKAYFNFPTITDSLPSSNLKSSKLKSGDKKNPAYCPLLGIKTAFETLLDEWIFFASIDSPFLSQKNILKLFQSRNEESQILYFQTPSHTHFLNAFFHRSTLDMVMRNLANHSYALHHLYSQVQTSKLVLDNELEFSNINTPQEYEQALRYWQKISEEF